jgi:hypothetical protein
MEISVENGLATKAYLFTPTSASVPSPLLSHSMDRFMAVRLATMSEMRDVEQAEDGSAP